MRRRPSARHGDEVDDELGGDHDLAAELDAEATAPEDALPGGAVAVRGILAQRVGARSEERRAGEAGPRRALAAGATTSTMNGRMTTWRRNFDAERRGGGGHAPKGSARSPEHSKPVQEFEQNAFAVVARVGTR